MILKHSFKFFYMLVLGTVLSIGCTSQSSSVATSNTSTTKTETTEALATDYILATVTDQYLDGCGYMLQTSNNANKGLYSPVGDLPKSYQKNGAKMMIKFRPSRAPQKPGCTQGKPIIIEDIKKVK